MSQIKTVGVIGAGQMGSGIAQVFATAGFHVILQDISLPFCERGFGGIKKSLGKMLEKGKMTQQVHDEAIARIQITTDIHHMKDADFVVEAATENVDLKLGLFKQLDAIVPAGTILATNTSSISITKIAAATKRPQKVIGMHFMNPVPLMKGLELIRGKETDSETEKTVIALGDTLGKTISRSNDFAGFIANRVLMPMINEAAWALHTGVAEKEDIDKCLVTCCNFPMGPLTLADFIGLDTVVAILNVMYEGLKEEKYKPCPRLTELVNAGKLGRKAGEGFYKY